MTAKKMVRNIEPDDPMLQYSGRIDDDDPKAPVLIYAASWVKMILPEHRWQSRLPTIMRTGQMRWAIS